MTANPRATIARRPQRRGLYLVGLFAAALVGTAVIVSMTLATPSTQAVHTPIPPHPSPELVVSTDTFLQGQGVILVRLHRAVAAWLADPTSASCRILVATVSGLGPRDEIEAAIGTSPDPVLVDIGADEMSLLTSAIAGCASGSNTADSRLAVVDATLTTRLSQLGAAHGGTSP
jgi:hypothetical protein